MNSSSWEGWKAQVAAAHAEVIEDIKSKFREFREAPPLIDSVRAFCAAIDWTEPWIIALLAVQAALFISVVLTRKKSTYQTCVFFSAMIVVYNAERLNSFAAAHWKSFARQAYFQPEGLFTSVLLSTPLLLTMFVVLINYLLELGQLLVEMKSKELIYKARQRQRQGGSRRTAEANEPKKRR